MANAFSLEDKNLDVSTILTSRSRAYKDIDLTFKNIPLSGEIYQILSAINRHEPRAVALSVIAISDPDRNSVDVTIVFRVVNTQEEVSLSIALARLR